MFKLLQIALLKKKLRRHCWQIKLKRLFPNKPSSTKTVPKTNNFKGNRLTKHVKIKIHRIIHNYTYLYTKVMNV